VKIRCKTQAQNAAKQISRNLKLEFFRAIFILTSILQQHVLKMLQNCLDRLRRACGFEIASWFRTL